MSPFILSLIALLTALLPAIFWLVFWYKKDAEPEPKKMIFLAFCFGILGTLPFFGLREMVERSPNLVSLWQVLASRSFFLAPLFLVSILAASEEFVKHFAVLRLGKKLNIYFDQIVDGIVYSVAAALGFAFLENVLYFSDILSSTGLTLGFWKIFLFRSLGTMLGHALFSGVFGFFWGYAMFSRQICSKHSESVSRLWVRIFDTLRFHIIFHHVFKGRPSRRRHEKSDLVREGFLLATVLHIAFNLLIRTEVFGIVTTPFVVPILLFGCVWLTKRFVVKRNVRVGKAV